MQLNGKGYQLPPCDFFTCFCSLSVKANLCGQSLHFWAYFRLCFELIWLFKSVVDWNSSSHSVHFLFRLASSWFLLMCACKYSFNTNAISQIPHWNAFFPPWTWSLWFMNSLLLKQRRPHSGHASLHAPPSPCLFFMWFCNCSNSSNGLPHSLHRCCLLGSWIVISGSVRL